MRTSYSAIQTYLQCPQRYEFQNIKKIRVPKSREAIFGTLIHSTLRFMFKQDPLFPTLDEVVAYFREHWPTDDVLNQESKNDSLKRAWSEEEERAYFEQGVRMLKRFYEKNVPWNYHVIDLESRFDITLTDEKTGAAHVLAGIIDRIDKLPDGSYEIIDYKTGKRMPSQESLNSDLQLSLYSLGLQKRWPHLKPEDIKLSLYFLRHEEKLSAKTTPDASAQIKTNILQTISEIEERLKSGKVFEPVPSALCDWCGYRPLCPAWRHLYAKNQESGIRNQEETDKDIKEYFILHKEIKEKEGQLKELQNSIKQYMEQEGLTRVFGDDGVISQKTIQRYEYDLEKIKTLLSPLGKWEEILTADGTKLKKILGELPENIRREVESAHIPSRSYTSLAITKNRVKGASLVDEEI